MSFHIYITPKRFSRKEAILNILNNMMAVELKNSSLAKKNFFKIYINSFELSYFIFKGNSLSRSGHFSHSVTL